MSLSLGNSTDFQNKQPCMRELILALRPHLYSAVAISVPWCSRSLRYLMPSSQCQAFIWPQWRQCKGKKTNKKKKRCAHKQRRQSPLFPAEEQPARRTGTWRTLWPPPPLSPPRPPLNRHVWCGCLCMRLSRTCGQLVFVFTSKKRRWILGGEDDHWSWTASFKKLFASSVQSAFHLRSILLRNIRRTLITRGLKCPPPLLWKTLKVPHYTKFTLPMVF